MDQFPPFQQQPQPVVENRLEKEDEIDPEIVQRKALSAKRLFWVIVIFVVIVVALLGWELFDLFAGY